MSRRTLGCTRKRACRPLVVLAVLLMSTAAAVAVPLGEKNLAPDWGKASQAEKDAWIASFQFKKADADKAGVASCLDEHAGRQLFASSELSGVTRMCESIAALPD